MKIIALSLLVGLTVAAAACAGKTDDPSQGDEQDIKSSSTAKAGESCGGNILGAKQCASGLTCVFPQSNIAGTPGTCQSSSDPSCKFPVSCEDGTKGCADKGDPCASHGGECSAKGDSCVTEHDCCSNLKCDNDSAKPTFNCIAK